MIPVVTMDEDKKLSYQVFNDNLTTAEQINRIVFGTTIYAQTKLVNDKYSFDANVDTASYTADQLDKIKTAAVAMDKAVKAAIADFAKVVDDPDAE